MPGPISSTDCNKIVNAGRNRYLKEFKADLQSDPNCPESGADSKLWLLQAARVQFLSLTRDKQIELYAESARLPDTESFCAQASELVEEPVGIAVDNQVDESTPEGSEGEADAPVAQRVTRQTWRNVDAACGIITGGKKGAADANSA